MPARPPCGGCGWKPGAEGVIGVEFERTFLKEGSDRRVMVHATGTAVRAEDTPVADEADFAVPDTMPAIRLTD